MADASDPTTPDGGRRSCRGARSAFIIVRLGQAGTVGGGQTGAWPEGIDRRGCDLARIGPLASFEFVLS